MPKPAKEFFEEHKVQKLNARKAVATKTENDKKILETLDS
jgi:hypothetical protein